MFRKGFNPILVEIDYEIERENVSAILSVTGYAYPFIPARTYGPPEYCYPSDGGYGEISGIKIIEICDENGNKVKKAEGLEVGKYPNLDSDETRKIEEAIYDELGSAYDMARELEYDYRKENC